MAPDSSQERPPAIPLLVAATGLLGKTGVLVAGGAFGAVCLVGAWQARRAAVARRQIRRLVEETAGTEARAVITGATSGIGRELAHQLLRHPSVSMLVGCRDVTRAEYLYRQAITVDQPRCKVVPLDLLDFDSVQNFADEAHEFLAGGGEGFRLLVNNAGIMNPPPRKTAYGHDVTWQTNFLAPYLLTELVGKHRQKLKSKTPLRVVQVSSRLERHSKLDQQLLDEVTSGQPGDNTYSDSKRALMLWTSVRAQSLCFQGNMHVHAATPGVVNTELGRYAVPSWLWPFTWPLRCLIMKTPAEGAFGIVGAGLRQQATERFGRYCAGDKELEDLVMERMGEKQFALKVVQWASKVTALETRAMGYDR